jgi:hypothetical protein
LHKPIRLLRTPLSSHMGHRPPVYLPREKTTLRQLELWASDHKWRWKRLSVLGLIEETPLRQYLRKPSFTDRLLLLSLHNKVMTLQNS